jgi:uncharacterized OsmC-like protein/pimeloyl-ACP methyl ester carboxylesterase
VPRIRFTNRQGFDLVGTLELPPGGSWRATAVFAHCFTCTRNIRAAHAITRALAHHGFAVLRFDFTGLGESDGDFADTNFSSNLDDLEDAASWLAAELAAPELLVGHSLGGTAILAVAPRIASARAVVTLAAPASPEHVLRHFDGSIEQIEREGEAEVELAGRPFRIRRDFLIDAGEHDLPDRIRSLRRALLVLHSPTDQVVSIANAERIFTAALHPKSFVSLDQADHLLSDETDAVYAGDVIAAWAERFLSAGKEDVVQGVRVAGATADAFTCVVEAGRHRLTADEPKASGGADLGPDPYDYLAAALGACTVMTLNMYARHKQLPVERVVCEVTHRKIHAQDCADCTTREGKVDELFRRIAISGTLDDAQRARMLEIADRCPVHRTLGSEIRIRSTLAD